MPRPDAATMTAFTTALEGQLDAANPPGRHLDTPAFQRLNRTEYANAVRDLLAVDVDVRALLPGDDSSEGFDNIAEALTVSPSLVQGYVAAALKISRRAIGDRTAAPSQVTYSAPRPVGAREARRGPAARHARRLAGHAHVSAGRGVRAVDRGRRARRRRRVDHRHHARRPAAHGRQPAHVPAADHGGPAYASAWRWSIGRAAPAWTTPSPTIAPTRRLPPPAACRR